MNKHEWGPGPWHDEDDLYEGVAHGLPWIIKRNERSGYFCGYVGVASDNKLHGKRYGDEVAIDDIPHDWRENVIGDDVGVISTFLAACNPKKMNGTLRLDCALRVHGGITWSEDGDGKYLPKGRWWFGFDCARSGDLSPGQDAYMKKVLGMRFSISIPDTVYRDAAYVRAQCERLAEQLAHFQPVVAGGDDAAKEASQ